MAFLELLSRKGDSAKATDQLGLPLFVLFRHRDAGPAFTAEWLAAVNAVNYALELVEGRALAALLNATPRRPTKRASRCARRPCDRA